MRHLWQAEVAPGRVRRDLIGFALGLFGGLCVGVPTVFGGDPEAALVSVGPAVPISGIILLRAATTVGRRRPRRRRDVPEPLPLPVQNAAASESEPRAA